VAGVVNKRVPLNVRYGARLVSRVPPQRELGIVVRASFVLRPDQSISEINEHGEADSLHGDTFHGHDEARAGALLHSSDFADFKPKTDLLLRATCYPEGGRSAREVTARFAVGRWSKSIRVFGPRAWTEIPGDPISQPVPFATMPLVFENAFGGPGYAKNPVGKGFGTPQLPNLEDPACPIRSKRDRPEPACFGPTNPGWPQRRSKLGTEYGKEWKKTRAPFYAADFDWTYFNAAPADQQLPGYLRGDEELAFDFLHPKAAHFTTRLPGLRVRAFVRHVDGKTLEVPMNMDTLAADLEEEKLVLLWRGLTPVKDDDFDDVRTLFVAVEPLDRPEPESHYVAQLDAFEKNPLSIDEYLTPETKARIEEAKKLAEEAKQRAALPRPEPAKDPMDRIGALMDAHARGLPEAQRTQMAQVLDKVTALMAQSKANAGGVGKTGVPAAAGSWEPVLTDLLERSRAQMVARGLPVERIDEAKARLAAAKAKRDAVQATIASAPKAARGGGDPTIPGPGANLMGRDFTGADLHGANLERALLRGAKLARANLAGAVLRRADLSETDLASANIAGADLSQAILMGTCAHGACFDGATLKQTVFARADLTEASFVHAQGDMAIFTEAKLADATLRGAQLHKAVFLQAALDRVDASGARLSACTFIEASCGQLRMIATYLEKTTFLNCDLSGAVMDRARGERNSFQGSRLLGASVSHARLPFSFFLRAVLDDARFFAADLEESRFDRASLARTQLVDSDLLRASFGRAKLAETSFVGSNLYDSRFFGAVATAKCDFARANLKLALWELP
jgi:uncharacterized protein YjbI with pentapeptide repeats